MKQCDRPELARAAVASSCAAGQARRPDRAPLKLSQSARRVPQSQCTWQRKPCEVAIARPQERHCPPRFEPIARHDCPSQDFLSRAAAARLLPGAAADQFCWSGRDERSGRLCADRQQSVRDSRCHHLCHRLRAGGDADVAVDGESGTKAGLHGRRADQCVRLWYRDPGAGRRQLRVVLSRDRHHRHL